MVGRRSGSSPYVWGRRKTTAWQNNHGSSPYVWGRLCQPPQIIDRLRFIPIRVGKTYSSTIFPTASPTGSSPYVWGRLADVGRFHLGERFIPIRVGKTLYGGNRWLVLSGSSPYVWGRRNADYPASPFPVGSSPYVWGRPRSSTSRGNWWTVHPHTCGEDQDRFRSCRARSGSSPYVWGRRQPLRVSGTVQPGSSPYVWGRRRTQASGRHSARFIPIRVGKTLSN